MTEPTGVWTRRGEETTVTCGRCQEPMTVEGFFAETHPCWGATVSEAA